MDHNITRKKISSRRAFLRQMTATAFGVAVCSTTSMAKIRAEIIVIGGGVGGVTFIRALLALSHNVNITLIEPTALYHNCPLSSHVLAGLLIDDTVQQSYINVASLPNVTWVRDRAERINPDKKQLLTASGTILAYDKLIVSPGIGLITNTIENYSSNATPHGWKNDSNLFTLRDQLHAMDDGGVFLITAPLKPYRCMPAPYERAGLVASYLKKHKPSSKILILDQKPSFPQQELFLEAWQTYYGDMIEWVTSDFVGEITAYSSEENAIETEFDTFTGDVINLIPNQNAGKFAHINGLVNDSGWCPIDLRTMESTLINDIYVIGDAIDNSELPKAASISETQAYVAAEAISAELNNQEPSTATFNSLCWSATDEGHAVKVMGAYHVDKGGALIRDSLALSSPQDSDEERAYNYAKAESWNTDFFARLYDLQ